MFDANPHSTASIAGRPIHPILTPFPIVLFSGAFVTDLVYWRTANAIWETFSVWLLTAGLFMGALAGIAGLMDFLGSSRIRSLRPAWPHMLGNVLVLILSIINVLVHSRDGYTAVVPQGVTLSGVVVALLLFTGWRGGSLVYRHRAGVAN
jgi:uncharacterized membrane protein